MDIPIYSNNCIVGAAILSNDKMLNIITSVLLNIDNVAQEWLQNNYAKEHALGMSK